MVLIKKPALFTSLVHKIEVPTPFPIGNTNAYLIKGDPLTLIDVGPKTEAAKLALAGALRGLGHSLEEIERIILTHAHLDHWGLAGEIRRISNAEVYLHSADREFLEDYWRAFEVWVDRSVSLYTKGGFTPKIVAMMTGYETKDFMRSVGEPVATSPLEEGDGLEIRTPGRSFELEVIHCPGHAASEICLYERGERCLFSGDHLLAEITPNPFVSELGEGLGLRNYLNSLKKIENLDVGLVLPGHGPHILDFRGRIDEIYAHHGERKRAVLGALRGGREMSAAEVSKMIFGDLPCRR